VVATAGTRHARRSRNPDRWWTRLESVRPGKFRLVGAKSPRRLQLEETGAHWPHVGSCASCESLSTRIRTQALISEAGAHREPLQNIDINSDRDACTHERPPARRRRFTPTPTQTPPDSGAPDGPTLTEPTLACPLDFGNASLSSEEPLAAHMAPVRRDVWLFGKLISSETPAPILTFDSKSDFTPAHLRCRQTAAQIDSTASNQHMIHLRFQ
jgi:hypothetical protein